MAITNIDKPSIYLPGKHLLIGGGYKLLIGGSYYLLLGQSTDLVTLTNQDKISQGETWGHIGTTWASETHTWLEVSQTIGNTAKPTGGITNIAKP